MRLTTAVGASSALLLATAASAFRDSSPLLVWSSHANDMLAESAAEINSGIIDAESIFGSLSSIGCDWDAVVVAHIDELHESHIEAMDLPFGGKAKAALHIPYLVRPARDTLDTAVSSWAQRCGAELVESTDGSGEVKEIVYVNAAQGELDLPALPKRHLVVLTGTRDLSKLKSESRRDERPFEEFEDELKDKKPSTKPGKNDTTTPGPEHYEYFTTPLLSALLVTFLIFLPILFLGLYALSGIQVPPRLMDINKSVSVNKQRKEQ